MNCRLTWIHRKHCFSEVKVNLLLPQTCDLPVVGAAGRDVVNLPSQLHEQQQGPPGPSLEHVSLLPHLPSSQFGVSQPA